MPLVRERAPSRGIFQPPAKLLLHMTVTTEYKAWMCLICGWIYDEQAGLPDEGIPPGTRWEDVPMNWTCPECGARKDDFEMVEV
jgi:rubredoxin